MNMLATAALRDCHRRLAPSFARGEARDADRLRLRRPRPLLVRHRASSGRHRYRRTTTTVRPRRRAALSWRRAYRASQAGEEVAPAAEPTVKFADGKGRMFDPPSKVWFDGKSQCFSGEQAVHLQERRLVLRQARLAETNGIWQTAAPASACRGELRRGARRSRPRPRAREGLGDSRTQIGQPRTQPTAAEVGSKPATRLRSKTAERTGGRRSRQARGADRVQEVLPERRRDAHRAVRRVSRDDKHNCDSHEPSGGLVMQVSSRPRPSAASAGPGSRAGKRRKAMPMAAKLAYRNLFHDRLSLAVTLVGIVFSVVLVAVQFGLYLGSENRIAAMLDHAQADLWVVPLGTKSFDDPSLPAGPREARHPVHARRRQRRGAGRRLRQLAQARGRHRLRRCWSAPTRPRGKRCPGTSWRAALPTSRAPDGVAVDRTYFKELGISSLGDRAEVNNMQVTVAAVTQGIRSFTTLPYVFTTLGTRPHAAGCFARADLLHAGARLAPGSDMERCARRLPPACPMPRSSRMQEFRKRSLDYWLFETGAGSALIAGAALGIIVGIVIVAQTLYCQHQGSPERVRHPARARRLGPLHPQGHPACRRS